MKSRLPSLFATGYIPLSTIPSLTGAEIAANGDIGAYLQSLYTFGVSAAAGLAVIMVIWGGIEYITSASGEGKGGGKEKITSAILGLLLALGSYIILNTINPELLTLKFFVEELEIKDAPKFVAPNFVVPNPVGQADFHSDAQGFLVDSNGQKVTDSSGKPIQTGVANGDGFHVNPDGDLYDSFDQPVNGAGNKPIHLNVGGSGSIAASSKAGSSFPNQSWNDYALNQIQQSGLLNLKPSDAAKYFPNGQPTAQGYVSLLASIARSESGFNANDNLNKAYVDFYDKNGKPVYSQGLFSISDGDAAVKQLASKYGISTQQVIANPLYNIEASVNIMNAQIKNTGSITGSQNNHYWGPLFRGE